jgi:hypothetical protein
MGKKNKKGYKYTKHEFMSICCSKCGICHDGFSPDLCYSDLYVVHPKKFIKVIFRNLLKSKHLITEYNPYMHGHVQGMIYNEALENFFIKVFCSANLCDKYNSSKQCVNINMCLSDFKYQLNGHSTADKVSVFSKKKNQRYVVQPYPTFFTNENEKFSKEIKRILATGKKWK